MELTQEGLSERSGVPLPTLRKFEQKGNISLTALVKLLMIVGGLEDVLTALTPEKRQINTIEEVLKASTVRERQRGKKNEIPNHAK